MFIWIIVSSGLMPGFSRGGTKTLPQAHGCSFKTVLSNLNNVYDWKKIRDVGFFFLPAVFKYLNIFSSRCLVFESLKVSLKKQPSFFAIDNNNSSFLYIYINRRKKMIALGKLIPQSNLWIVNAIVQQILGNSFQYWEQLNPLSLSFAVGVWL